MRAVLLFSLFVSAACCALPLRTSQSKPDADISGTQACMGCSIETAVVVNATDEQEVRAEEELWLKRFYPGYFFSDAFSAVPRNNHYYDCRQAIYQPSIGDNTGKVFYFDVSACYGRK